MLVRAAALRGLVLLWPGSFGLVLAHGVCLRCWRLLFPPLRVSPERAVLRVGLGALSPALLR